MKVKLKNVILAGAAAMVIAAGFVVAGTTQESADAHEPGVTTATAIIRVGSGGPQLHENSTHASQNISSVDINSNGDIVVYRTDWGTGSKVLTCMAVGDESFAMKGIQVGCSGGGSKSVLRMYDRNGNHVSANNYKVFDTPYFNVWFRADAVQ